MVGTSARKGSRVLVQGRRAMSCGYFAGASKPMSATETQAETQILVNLMREYETEGRRYSASIEDVPEATGHYGLSDGLRSLGGGVTDNMRQSILRLAAHRQIK